MGNTIRGISILVCLGCLLLSGCSWGQTTSPFMGSVPWTPPAPDGSPSSALGVLNWTAGLSILGGIVGMMLSRGRTGILAIVIGAILVILSYVIAAYSHLVLLPIGIVLTIISAVWGYRTIITAWKTRK